MNMCISVCVLHVCFTCVNMCISVCVLHVCFTCVNMCISVCIMYRVKWCIGVSVLCSMVSLCANFDVPSFNVLCGVIGS